MSPRAEPVKIIKADGSSHVATARDFRQRPAEAAEESIPIPPEERTPDGAVTLELLEEQIMRTLLYTMQHAEKLSERTAAATAGVKFMAVKAKMGEPFGGDLDE